MKNAICTGTFFLRNSVFLKLYFLLGKWRQIDCIWVGLKKKISVLLVSGKVGAGSEVFVEPCILSWPSALQRFRSVLSLEGRTFWRVTSLQFKLTYNQTK